ncbi:PRONE domain-containing protein [Forsythia ovata]|uniref:PRONE domain-containing protein n=1 Tax=Forsythia ovata TaxID=205694 RepID=A0ABD1RLC2_9LAMI
MSTLTNPISTDHLYIYNHSEEENNTNNTRNVLDPYTPSITDGSISVNKGNASDSIITNYNTQLLNKSFQVLQLLDPTTDKRSSLGDLIYKSITVEFFDPQQFLSMMDLSSEHKLLDLKNRIEASIVIWKRKMHHKDGKSGWGSAVSLEKRKFFEERAETILLLLKHRFP